MCFWIYKAWWYSSSRSNHGVHTYTHTWMSVWTPLPAHKRGGQKRTNARSWFSFHIYGTEVGAVVSSATAFSTSLAISTDPHLKFDLLIALWVWGGYIHGGQQDGCSSLCSTFPGNEKFRKSTRATVCGLVTQAQRSCSAHEIVGILFNKLWQQYLDSSLPNSSMPDTHTQTHTQIYTRQTLQEPTDLISHFLPPRDF